jgi:dTDP-4-amino-4,6-dideoxygalactose transaminase
VLTDDDEVYYRTLLYSQYSKRCQNELPPGYRHYRYAVTGVGLKFRIHPLAAAIALDQLGHLDGYLAGRASIGAHLCEQLDDLSGIVVPRFGPGVRSSWYGLILQYRAEELGGLSVERFYEALKAEGCQEVDRPGSTCPLNLLPLFQEPGPLFPEKERDRCRALGQRRRTLTRGPGSSTVGIFHSSTRKRWFVWASGDSQRHVTEILRSAQMGRLAALPGRSRRDRSSTTTPA